MKVEFPAMVGETVFALFRELPKRKKKPTRDDLDEGTVIGIERRTWDPDFLVTIANEKKTDYTTFWLNEFGEKVFTKEQYFALK